MSLVSPDYVEELRASKPRDVLARQRSTCGLLAVLLAMMVALQLALRPVDPTSVGMEVFVATLLVVAVTAHLGMRSTLRPATALRVNAILLVAVAAMVAAYVVRLGLFAAQPVIPLRSKLKWIPVVPSAVVAYTAALVVAVWRPHRARYLTWIVGAMAVAGEAVLIAHYRF